MTQERAFLSAILQKPDDDTTRLVYADWLEEQGDPRGEFLREMVKWRQERVTPGQRQRHAELAGQLQEVFAELAAPDNAAPDRSPQTRRLLERHSQLQKEVGQLTEQIRQSIPPRLGELAATFDPNWLAVVGDPITEGCGKVPWLRFDFLCDRSWAEMNPTQDDSVRHCDACDQSVHFCDNLADAREHARAGHCVAVDLGVIRRERDLASWIMLGQPSAEDLREMHEIGLDAVSQARLDARKRKKDKRA